MLRVLLMFVLAAGMVGCSKTTESSATGAGKHQITTTVGMIADIVRRVAGDKAEVTNIIGEGVDPHLYKPTAGDTALLFGADTDVVFYNGLLLEGKMQDVLLKAQRKGKKVYAVTELLPDDYVQNSAGGHYDPHVWMDARGWIYAVGAVTNALSDFDPGNAAYYQANADAYVAELDKLDAYARKSIASIPEPQRVLVTAHDAFGYMSRAYGIDVHSPQGISTESEPSVKDITDLVDFLVERKINAVFPESSVSPKNLQALVEGARAAGHEVVIGGELFSDAMGKPGTYEGTYIGMIDHNVTTITRALGGEAPEKGLNGKLSH